MNDRCPDVVADPYGTAAVNHGTYRVGGPDFLIEIISPGEDPTGKLDSSSAVGTREVLVVGRDPWAIELYQLVGGRLVSAGRSDPATPAAPVSGVLPRTFALRSAQVRPVVDVTHPATGRTWTA